MSDKQIPLQHKFHVPPELEAGEYANVLSVWHSGHEFTLDFASTLPAQPKRDESGAVVAVTQPCRVVARVKISPTVIFDLIRAVNDNMGKYESRFGPIEGLGADGSMVPPDDLMPNVRDDATEDDDANDGDANDGDDKEN